MSRRQFRILYREFLFRVVDRELLSSHAQGDATKILGQFAALLVFLSIPFSLVLLTLSDAPRETAFINAWGIEHLLIATTMLVVGLFAVLGWDSTFPDRRDVLVLAPLPVHTRTFFVAKIAASATVLGLAVMALNTLPSLAWSLATAPSSIPNLAFSPALYRSFAAYAITMISASGFIFGSVLCVQGLAAQLLPRWQFLRVSAFLQMTAFCLLVSAYFLEPTLTTPAALAAPRNQHLLACLPSYWFLGLFQQLNGSMHPALASLAQRAWIGLMIVGSGTGVVYTLSYFRTIRKIAEEPDITPGRRGSVWLPKFGDPFETAVTQFSARTLLRSRQHRLILAFYFGVGFAITILFLKTPGAQRELMAVLPSDPWGHASGPLLASSVAMISAWIAGSRVVFSMPVDLRANWIFRVTPNCGAPACLRARRGAFFVLAMVPAWVASTVFFMSIAPWKPAIAHVVILTLFGTALTEICLFGIQKIPFTCSYLPGKSNFHVTVLLGIWLVVDLIGKCVEYERRALGDWRQYLFIVAVLSTIAVLARIWNESDAHLAGADARFEDEPPDATIVLGLRGDGAV